MHNVTCSNPDLASEAFRLSPSNSKHTGVHAEMLGSLTFSVTCNFQIAMSIFLMYAQPPTGNLLNFVEESEVIVFYMYELQHGVLFSSVIESQII